MTVWRDSIGTPEVQVLGPVRIAGQPGALRGRQAALVTAMVLAAPNSVPREELARWVFGSTEPQRLDEVRVLVSRLRRSLRECESSATVVHDGAGYILGGASTDVSAFEQLVESAVASEQNDPAGATALARAANELWRGDVTTMELADHPAMIRLRERRLRSFEVRFGAELRLGRHDRCLAELLAACRMYPYAENLWRAGMIALYRSGRQADALALYREIRTRLVEDLGVEPGPSLRRAELQILKQEIDEISSQPEPSERSRSHVPAGWLGFQPYDDVYFEDRHLAAQFEKSLGDHRQVTVVGTAGVGKTRLVVEQILALHARWPDGAIFCELSGVENAAAVALTIASAACARVPAGVEPTMALAEHLATRRLLLVLDTCEHVRATVAAIIDGLMRRCPLLTVVATSRTPLDVRGEFVFQMSRLDSSTLGTELFIERMRTTAGSEFITEDRSVIETLCARLDGLPLAIELAAAQVRAVSPAELVDRLDRRLALLRSRRTVTDRHSSLRTAFDWSYCTLDPTDQRVLRVLGAFATSASLAGVEEVAAPCAGDVAVALGNLVDQSLIVARRRGQETRYLLLDSVKAYARELLDAAGEREATLECHARHVARLKDTYVARAEGEGEPAAVLQLDELWPDLRAALHWAVAAGRRSTAFDLLAGLGVSAILREKTEVRDWADAACRMNASAEPERRLFEVLAARAIGDWTLADFGGGIERSDLAYELWTESGSPLPTDVVAAGLLNGGAKDPGGYANMCRHLAQVAAAGHNLMGQTWALNAEGMAHAYQGRSSEALEVLTRARRLSARLGCPSQVALCQMARAIALLDDHPERALAAADEAIAQAVAAGSTWLFGAVPNYRAAALVRAGQCDAAAREVRSTLQRLAAGGTVQSVANTIRNAIAVADRLQQPERAAPLIAWLDTHPVGIPGTPGMRQQVVDLRARLADLLGEKTMARHLEEAASLTLGEVIDVALAALDGLG
jgi:predicted ATPase/DNA-binding SARP family transcriptional activator